MSYGCHQTANGLSADVWGPPSSTQNIWAATSSPYYFNNETPYQKPIQQSNSLGSTSSQITYEDDHSAYDWKSQGSQPGNSRMKNEQSHVGINLKKKHAQIQQHLRVPNKFGNTENYKEGDSCSPLNTSGSSITEEIFNTALSNLEFLSDEEPSEGSDDLNRKGSLTNINYGFATNID